MLAACSSLKAHAAFGRSSEMSAERRAELQRTSGFVLILSSARPGRARERGLSTGTHRSAALGLHHPTRRSRCVARCRKHSSTPHREDKAVGRSCPRTRLLKGRCCRARTRPFLRNFHPASCFPLGCTLPGHPATGSNCLGNRRRREGRKRCPRPGRLPSPRLRWPLTQRRPQQSNHPPPPSRPRSPSRPLLPDRSRCFHHKRRERSFP